MKEDYRILEMNLESPIFDELREQFDKAIKDAIKVVYNREFADAEITLKLSIELPETFRNMPKINDEGEEVFEPYKYRIPNFKHKVTTALKKQYVEEGQFRDDREVRLGSDGETFYAVKPEDIQIRLNI